MDAKEALKYFKGQTNEMQFISGGIRGGKSYRQEAYKAAIEALEKQVPKAPVQKVDCALGYAWYCPNCGCFIDPSTYKFCQDCGQAIKIDNE